MSILNLVVRSTTNYDRFKFLENINRPVKSNHVTKMKRAILKISQVIRPVIIAKIRFIDGIEREYILDGQHLFMALRALRLPIPYAVVDVEEDMTKLISTISTLNSTSVKWALKDYVHAWKSMKPEYVDLERYHQLYSISYQATGMLAMNTDRRKVVSDRIKKGEFTVTNTHFLTLCEEAFALLAIGNLSDLMRVPDRFIAGLIRYFNDVGATGYDREHLANNIRTHVDLIRAAALDSVDKVLSEYIFV